MHCLRVGSFMSLLQTRTNSAFVHAHQVLSKHEQPAREGEQPAREGEVKLYTDKKIK